MDNVWKIIIAALVLAIVAGLTVIIIFPQKTEAIKITQIENVSKKKAGIYGAVKFPGVYEYEGNIRINDAVTLAGGLTDDADAAHSNITKWIEDGETIIIPTASPVEPTLTLPAITEQKININEADKNELMLLPGIGEKRAEEIIRLRAEKGKFTAAEELMEIQGISMNLLEKIYDLIIVE